MRALVYAAAFACCIPLRLAAGEAATDAGREVTASSTALLANARLEAAAGHLLAARELCQRAVLRDPGDAAARDELARITAVLAGRAPAPAPADAQLRRELAEAEARMASARAELVTRSGRSAENAEQLGAARAALLPYGDDPAVRAQLQRLDALIQACRDQTVHAAAAAAQRQRDDDRTAAVARRDGDDVQARDALRQRLARILALSGHGHFDLALSACRQLVTDYPDEPRAERLFAQLLAASHQQRRLTQAEQKVELMQEVQERVERSMIPLGFDNQGIYPTDWAARRSDDHALLDAPTALPAWQLALLDRLANRISVDIQAQDAAEVLTALARQTGINLVLDPSLTTGGARLVTLKASNITLEHALSWICTQLDTRWHLTKGAIYVGGDEDLAPVTAVYDISDLLFQAKDQQPHRIGLPIGGAAGGGGGGGGALGVNLLKNAPADGAGVAIAPEDIVDHIEKTVSPATWAKPVYGISIHGTVLMVTAPPGVHVQIQALIRSLSHARNLLVRVDARWLIIEDGYLEEIGVEWTTANGLLQRPGTGVNGAGPSDGFHRATNEFDHTGSLTNILPATQVTPNPATFGTGLSLSATMIKATQLAAILTAVERNQRAITLSAPSVTTINGVRATCYFGQELGYINNLAVGPGGPNGLSPTLATQVAAIDTGGSLNVKPYISADGKYITMEFLSSLVTLEEFTRANLSVAGFTPTGFNPAANGGAGAPTGNTTVTNFTLETPNISSNEVATNVVFPDGGTLLVAGFQHHVEQTMSSEIPFLGHIPYLGRLFGQRGRYSNRYKLYLLATASVINYGELEERQ